MSHCLSSPLKLLHVSHCLLYCYLLSLTISLIPCSCWLSLTLSHCFWLSLTVSFIVPLTVSYIVAGCLSLSLWSQAVAACLSLSPTVAGSLSLSPIWLLAVSHTIPLSLAVIHCLSQCYFVAACLLLSPIVDALPDSHCLSGVATCLSQSPLLLLAFSHFFSCPVE